MELLSLPDFGDVYDNMAALAIAKRMGEHGKPDAALKVLHNLSAHVEMTQETKSLLLLPRIRQAILSLEQC